MANDKEAAYQFSYIIGAAAKALGKIGDPRAVQYLIKALKSEAEYIQLIKALGDEETRVRDDAAEALDKIGGRAVKPLIKAFKNEDWHVKHAIEYCLKTVNTKVIGALLNA